MDFAGTGKSGSARVDPEFYLRMLGDEHLISGSADPGRNPPLGQVGSAFVAVGLLDPETAKQVADDYALAIALRHPGGAMHWSAQRHVQQQALTAASPYLETPAVTTCTLPDEDGEQPFPYAVLGRDSAEIHFTYEGEPDWNEVAKAYPNPQGFPHSLMMTDDTGRSLPANVFPNQHNNRWYGRFATQQPLSQATRWLELGGRRIELHPASLVGDVRVEPLPDQDPVTRYLRHLMAVGAPFAAPNGPDHPVVAAFIEVGVLDPDDPVLEEMAYVATQVPPPGMHQAHMMHMAASSTFGVGGWPATPRPPAGPVLSPEWASITRQSRERGRLFVQPVGAVVELEETSAVLYALRSEADFFTVDTLVIGAMPDPHGDDLQVHAAVDLAWWAQDDFGDWYRGGWNGWSGGIGSRRGEVSYLPALNPRARRLRLLPTACRSRAIIDIDLPADDDGTGSAVSA